MWDWQAESTGTEGPADAAPQSQRQCAVRSVTHSPAAHACGVAAGCHVLEGTHTEVASGRETTRSPRNHPTLNSAVHIGAVTQAGSCIFSSRVGSRGILRVSRR